MRWPLAFLLLLAVPAALAHPAYLTSTPAHAEQVDAAPGEVAVTLTEPIEDGARMQVTGPDGARVDLGDLRVAGDGTPTLRVSLAGNLSDGVYTVTWHVLSSTDGHAIDDAYQFAVGDFEVAGRTAGGDHLEPGAILGKALLYAGFALGLGGAVFLLYVGGDLRMSARALMLGTVVHLAGLALLWVVAQEHSGLRAGEFATLATGKNLYARIVLGAAALAVCAFWLRRGLAGRVAPVLVAALLFFAALLTARLGHASQGGPAVVAIDLVHLVAAAVWVGALFLLVLTLARPPEAAEARRIGRRFGTVGLACVLLLLLSGIVVQLGILGDLALRHPDLLLGSTYGKALVGKVGLLFAMVAVAALHRFALLPAGPTAFSRFTARITRGRVAPLQGPREVGAFARLVSVETGFGLLAMTLAAILTTSMPPTEPEDTLELAGENAFFRMEATFGPAPAAPGSSVVRFQFWEIVPQGDGTRLEFPVPGASCGNDCRILVTFQADGAAAQGVALQAAPAGDAWEIERHVLWQASGPYTMRVQVETGILPRSSVEVPFTVAARASAGA